LCRRGFAAGLTHAGLPESLAIGVGSTFLPRSAPIRVPVASARCAADTAHRYRRNACAAASAAPMRAASAWCYKIRF
jgi:hypothetical protein